MRIETRARGFSLSPALAGYIERRVLFAVGRFGTRMGTVSIRLEDVNGPAGGVDKACRMTARVDRHSLVSAEGLHSDCYAAVDTAANRLGRGVERVVERARERGGAEPLAASRRRSA